MKSTGFYVEGRYYGQKYSQAFGRANFLSHEYGRCIDIVYQPPRGDAYRFETVLSARMPAEAQRRALRAA